jgi:hypothetical protein
MKGYTPWSHGMYWASPASSDGTAPERWDAIPRMQEAMDIGDFNLTEFAEERPPDAPGAMW